MPELPDLEIYAKNLTPLVGGRLIESATVERPNKVNVPVSYFSEALSGAKIQTILREGKELLFSLDNKNAFSVHFMLSGKTTLCTPDELPGIPARVASLTLDGGQAMAFSDYQGMLKVTLNPRKSAAPDALSDAFTQQRLISAAHQNRMMVIKAFLIDQRIVRGIGNAYADEILYAAGISPESTVGRIPGDKMEALHAAIRSVLKDAIAKIDEINPTLISGEERSFLKVHNRNLKNTALGEPIIKKTVAGKGTYYTTSQRLYL